MFVSRQPIYGRTIDLFAYQLAYPYEVFERAIADKGESAGVELFLETFLNPGLESFAGDAPAFINIRPSLILRGEYNALPKERVVLEISRTIHPDAAVLASLEAASKAGYRIALEGFDNTEEVRPLVQLATFFSVDFEALSSEAIREQMTMLKESKVKAIARGLDTHAALESAKSMGFDYFRGSCFVAPNPTTSTHVPINRLSTLQLVLKLQEPELSTSELEKIISQDLAISYKLLQYVNSAAFSLSRNIESIRTAIQMIGTERLRSWASHLFLSKLDDRPPELSLIALVRAKMAERLAIGLGAKNPDTFYMIGLFSLVDALLNLPMPEAIQLLPFSKEVREALLTQSGTLGSVLKCVLAYENGNWSDIRCGDLDASAIKQCYLDSIATAEAMPKILNAKQKETEAQRKPR
jgi:c-di-GMP phosphodiesterase